MRGRSESGEKEGKRHDEEREGRHQKSGAPKRKGQGPNRADDEAAKKESRRRETRNTRRARRHKSKEKKTASDTER